MDKKTDTQPTKQKNKNLAFIDQIDRGLYLISLPQPMEGFNRFICSWLVTGTQTLLVDVGTSGSVPFLLSALEELGLRKIDAILLTHIHLDHAGGIGEVAARWPDAPVFCHAKAIKHLVNPTQLWEGSLKNLGDLARSYGPISPVPEDRLVDAATCRLNNVNVIITPGHAPHHVSYCIDDNMLVGEAGGVYLKLAGGDFYMRPATPPKFFLETSLKSIDQLMSSHSKRICYGHFGSAEHPGGMLQQHREQLLRWRDIIAADMKHGMQADRLAILNHLLAVDPLMSGWESLSEAVRSRESSFLLSSIKGFIGYLQKNEDL